MWVMIGDKPPARSDTHLFLPCCWLVQFISHWLQTRNRATCQSFLLYNCWPCLRFNLWSVIKCVNISSRAEDGRGLPSLQSVLGESDLCLESLKLCKQYVITIYTERLFNAPLVCVWSTPTSYLQTSHKTNPTGKGSGLNLRHFQHFSSHL